MDSYLRKSERKIALVILVTILSLANYQAIIQVNASNYNELPKFVVHDVTDLDMIMAITKYRSSVGHDFPDSYEMEKSLKHYYYVLPQYYGTLDKVPIYSPVKGIIERLEVETTFNTGYQVWIRVEKYKNFFIRLMHINILPNITIGCKVTPGQLIGYAWLSYPVPYVHFDVAVELILSNCKNRYISIFEVMSDEVFELYKAKGIVSRKIMIKSTQEAERSPFYFNSPDPDDWVYLHHGHYKPGNYVNRSMRTLNWYLNLSSIGVYDDNIGIATDVFVSGDLLYVAGKPGGLIIIDISNLKKPKVLGYYYDDGLAYAVYVTGKYAYVADGPDGLEIIDVSNPFKPIKVGSASIGGYACDVFVAGKYAYVAYYANGLVIFDVSNPSKPKLIGSYFDGGCALGVFVKDNLAYVADGPDNLEIIDVSNPKQPVEIGQSERIALARKVYVDNNYAYVANDWNGLEVIDISNPRKPVIVGNYADFPKKTMYAYDIYVKNGVAFLADNYRGVHIIDVSSPSKPKYISTYYGGALGITGHGDFIVIAGMQKIEIVYAKSAYHLKQMCSLRVFGYGTAVVAEGAYAYLADSFGGLKIVDVSKSTCPAIIKTYNYYENNLVLDVFKKDNLLYLAIFYDGIVVLDVRNPESPKVVNIVRLKRGKSFTEEPRYYGVYVSSNYIYIAGYSRGLGIADISGREIGRYYDGGVALAVCVVGRYAYVADGSDGLEIIDVSDPSHPVKIGSFYDGGYAFDVVVVGKLAYVADGWDGLEIIDVSDPEHPVKIGAYRTAGFARSVFVNQTNVFIATGLGGLEVVDVSDPENPVRIGQYSDGEDIRSVYVSGNNVYIAEGWGGLKILRAKRVPVFDLKVNSSPTTIVYLNNEKIGPTPCSIQVVPGIYNVTLVYNGIKAYTKIIKILKNTHLNIYKVSISSSYGSVSGEGWFEEGSVITVKLKECYTEDGIKYVRLSPSIRAVFKGWKVSGKILTSTELRLKVNSSFSIEALWVKQYYVSVHSQHGVAKGEGWFNEGEIVTISIKPNICYEGENIRYVFKEWRGDVTSSNTTITVKVDKPIKVEAMWTTQYLIKIHYMGGTYSEWVEAGATWSAPSKIPKHIPGLVSYTLVGFKDKNGVEYGLSFKVNKPLELEAVYEADYTLLIATAAILALMLLSVIYIIKKYATKNGHRIRNK